ncbi:ATP-binding response regulator [Pseudoalteromonas luteoviolacea]|uniref:Response regulatory domain-containing protein n=1 Tax=Pseudoalteromonas luteoviolacea H33 TaxID=1365251 RepID=A0A167D893_9GAMM|nr:hybrid sensor histidine kinase/response regulator [Pseudoalteromonas luteoviolacea]KZN48530.1 hypothetical protein N476_21900 [Pseudoalteromonas luteoviolacea H33]KZN73391.1 hypothetical protein N477_24000 [Pseudoalteromonas luteoviolacea H33-S]MBQ4876501.1 hybrid sensor histidine kinase/response regulator [Pseudoalteromonas luteoviolacea]MBQ4905132.1 hybrid sensor histidine kinase/response regulator [Pseudoalteromonas luteoviolacea]
MADILIVDDIAENLQILQLILRNEGHKVYAAISGEVAMTIAQAHLPELIISDINMPNMDGLELCKLLKQSSDTTHIPVIFVSAERETDQIVEALEVGGVDYITKPFKPAEVLARVNTQLKLIEANKLAVRQQLSQVMNQMVVGIAHEINTPLGAAITASTHFDGVLTQLIESFDNQTLSAEQLKDGLEESKQGVALCERNLQRVAKFVKVLKDIAQIERPTSPEPLNTISFLNDLKSAWSKKGVMLEISALDMNFVADRDILLSVFDSLLDNSLAHADLVEGKALTIEVSIKGQHICFLYYDHGHGLQGITIDELLKPFITTKRGNSGHVGLSASVTANLIDSALNGNYHLSEDGRGLEWQIEIPINSG